MGKGSKPRPIPNRAQFEENWDRIFGKNIPSADAIEHIMTSPRETRQEKFDRAFEEKMIINSPNYRKKTPKHAATQTHTDKTKVIPRRYKYNNIEEQL